MRTFNLVDVLEYLGRNGRRIGLWAIGLAALGYAASYLVPSEYRAVAVILPPEEDELTAALSSTRRALGALGGLGRLGGQYFTQADVALATIRSRSVHERVIAREDLQQVYKAKDLEGAVRQLRDKTDSRIATDGTISVSVTDRSAKRAADIANAFLDELDRSTRDFRSARARRTREFLTVRLVQADSVLRLAENDLASYQGRRGGVIMSPEARGAADLAAGLMGQKLSAEVELSVLAGYTSPQSEEYRRLETRVHELSRQISALPAAGIGGASIIRRVAVQQQVVAILSTSLEEARIREVMDTPTIQVLDPAVAPVKKSWPRRGIVALFGLLVGLGVGVVRGEAPRTRAVGRE